MIDPARVRALAEEMENDETIPPMTTAQAEQVVRVLGSRPVSEVTLGERASGGG